ncbi:cupin domain-containing protein [Legionella saoudiensis]|uniref:cysteine dioxygenase n=1 Tax=Legionella saoudiensis TaxID=1750561 RepID=UPI000B001311|nr:cysteine dioxygenase [Legionella saoudiensis]
MMFKTEVAHAKKQNMQAISKAIHSLEVIDYIAVSKLLPQLLAEGKLKLDTSAYKPEDLTKNTGVGRHLIYDHKDPDNPFSIWVFVFLRKQKTSIHDHKYKGTVTVLEGPITEKFYLPTGEHTAALNQCVEREQFDTNWDDLTGSFVHQLKCRKTSCAEISMTLHIYNMPAYQCLDVENRNLNVIYSKDKTKKNTCDSNNEDNSMQTESNSTSASFS